MCCLSYRDVFVCCLSYRDVFVCCLSYHDVFVCCLSYRDVFVQVREFMVKLRTSALDCFVRGLRKSSESDNKQLVDLLVETKAALYQSERAV